MYIIPVKHDKTRTCTRAPGSQAMSDERVMSDDWEFDSRHDGSAQWNTERYMFLPVAVWAKSIIKENKLVQVKLKIFFARKETFSMI